MRTLLAAAVPALLLMAAGPGHAQSTATSPTATPPGKAEAVASGTMDTGARDLVPSRDLVGKTVVHRHGGPVAGTVQDVTTGADGRPAIVLKLANGDRTVTLRADDFERRGDNVVVMHDPDTLSQQSHYGAKGQDATGAATSGSSATDAPVSGSSQ